MFWPLVYRLLYSHQHSKQISSVSPVQSILCASFRMLPVLFVTLKDRKIKSTFVTLRVILVIIIIEIVVLCTF